MSRKRKRVKVSKTESEAVANAAVGAVVGGVVAGPVGAVIGAAVGALVENGPAKRKSSAAGVPQSRPANRRRQRRTPPGNRA